MGLLDKWDKRNSRIMRDHSNMKPSGSQNWYDGIFKDRFAKPLLIASIGISLLGFLIALILTLVTAL